MGESGIRIQLCNPKGLLSCYSRAASWVLSFLVAKVLKTEIASYLHKKKLYSTSGLSVSMGHAYAYKVLG